MPALKHLALRRCRGIDDTTSLDLTQESAPLLEYLDLSENRGLNLPVLRLDNLETLRLMNMPGVTDMQISQIISR